MGALNQIQRSSIIGLGANFAVRMLLKQRGDRQTKRTEEAAEERLHPEQFTDYEG